MRLRKRHPVELVQHCFVEALDDSIGLRALGLGSGVVHILDREIELVLVVLRVSAIFRASVGQHAAQPDLVLIIEGHHTVVEEIGRGERGLAIVELSEGDLGIGVDEGLLVDAPDPGLSGFSCAGGHS